MKCFVNCAVAGIAFTLLVPAAGVSQPAERPLQGRQEKSGEREGQAVGSAAFRVPATWEYSPPLISPEKREKDPSRAQKDPTLVFCGGGWHVFMTVKLPGRSAIEYCSFEKWKDADGSPRTILKISDSDYYCAPQVFYFAPHEKWYLIYQMGVPGAKKMGRLFDDLHHRGARLVDQGPADPRRRAGRPAPGRRARLLDHLRRPASLPVLNQSERQDVAVVDGPGGFPKGLRPLRAGARGQDLRGQPHVQAQGAGQVPDDRRGERPAVLQGLRRRPAGRRLDARSRHRRAALCRLEEHPSGTRRRPVDRQRQPRRAGPRRLRPDALGRSRQPAARLPGHVGQGQVGAKLRAVFLADRVAEAGGVGRDGGKERRRE